MLQNQTTESCKVLAFYESSLPSAFLHFSISVSLFFSGKWIWVLSDWFLFISRNAATLKIKLQGFDCRLQLGRLFNHVHGESLVIIGAHSVLGESHVSHTQTVSLRLAKFRRSRNDTLEFEPSFSVVVWNVMHLYENNVRQSAQDSAQQTANYWYPGPVVCLAVKNKWAIVSIRAG